MGTECRNEKHGKKITRPIDREYNTPLYLLRCAQIGLTQNDLNVLTYGTVLDMFCERGNDDYEYPEKATQDDINKFFG